MTDTTGELYRFDYLEHIVGISFPSGGYVLLEVIVDRTQPGGVRPPTPSITLVLPEGVTLIDKQETETTQNLPAKTVIDHVYFVWRTGAPFPTLANYQNIVVGNLFPTVAYVEQFARVTVTFTGVQVLFNNPFTTGRFPSLAAAQTYASALNSGTSYGYIDANGAVIFQGAQVGGFSAGQLAIPVVTPAQKVSRITGRYLLKVPKGKEVAGAAEIFGASGSATNQANIKGYHGRAPKLVSQVNLTAFDSTAEVKDIGGSSKLEFDWTAFDMVDPASGNSFNQVTIKASSGPVQ